MKFNIKQWLGIGSAVAILIVLLVCNPWAINDSGYRTHVQTITGSEHIQFDAGIYFKGFFSKTTEYPDVITVQLSEENKKNVDVTFHGGLITTQFND